MAVLRFHSSRRPLTEPAAQRRESDPEDGGDQYQQNRWVGQVGFRICAVDLMRDQDGSAEDRAGDEPALGTSRCSDVSKPAPIPPRTPSTERTR